MRFVKGVLALGMAALVTAGVAAEKPKAEFPREGMFLASGVYGSVGHLLWTGGPWHTEWCPELPVATDIPRLAREENQGNTLQYWSKAGNIVPDSARVGKEDLYFMFMCGSTDAKTCEQVKKNAKFAAFDLHEMFSFGLYANDLKEKHDDDSEKALRAFTLGDSLDHYLATVRKTVDRLHADGWYPLTCSAANPQMDLKMLGGVDVPGIEFYPFAETLWGIGLLRGLSRQYGVGAWHAYLAHDWYSYLPHTNPHKMDSLRTMLQVQYLGGVKYLTLESGNWWLQSNLCSDSPQMYLPQLGHSLTNAGWMSTERALSVTTADERLEAKRKYSWIDYRSPIATKYRRIMSDFWDFVKAHPQSDAQPEATMAFLRGNYDFALGYQSNWPIAGAWKVAEADRHWMCGAPELTWDVMLDVFFPKPPMFVPNRNTFYSATPYGQVDVVSLTRDTVTADFLLRNYKTVCFAGWNTCTPAQYRVLCDYVNRGGRLFVAIPHLSTNAKRNYDFYAKEELINGGDFSDLCGIKVLKKGERFYWATGTGFTPNCLGLRARRRYGIMGSPLGELEYTQPKENYETLACDDERGRPVIIRAKKGKGEVFFLNTWEYPNESNRDNGTGATEGSKGLIGELYAYLARLSRGNVWITGPDFEKPDADCGWIVYSYNPGAGRIHLLNLDYDRARKCVLHWFGEKDFITLEPGEFRLIDAPVLDPEERLNSL